MIMLPLSLDVYVELDTVYSMEGNFGSGKFGEFTAKIYWWNKIWQICYVCT